MATSRASCRRSTEIPLEEKKPGMLDKLRGAFTLNPFAKDEKKLNTTVTFASNQDLLDTLWGYYFATGSHVPIQRILQMLPWSKSRDTLDKLHTSAAWRAILWRAMRSAMRACANSCATNWLNGPSRRSRHRSRKWSMPPTPCRSRTLRKDALAAVDELKIKGSDSRRNLDFWGQVGVGAIALGCVSAAALGQVAVGIPCVIGGSASQGLLSFWEKQQ